MQHLFIDESGSMTCEHSERWPYFIIAVVWARNPFEQTRYVKRFVSKNLELLKKQDKWNKMFINGKFSELKGSSMSSELKIEFSDFMLRGDGTIGVAFVKINNAGIKYGLYGNTARAFNFVLGKLLHSLFNAGILPRDSYMLHIDERNEKTGTTHFLEEYLSTQFLGTADNIKVRYYDSSDHPLVQVADVLSNMYYINQTKREFSEHFRKLDEQGDIMGVYSFPEYSFYTKER